MLSIAQHDIGDVWTFYDSKSEMMHLFFLVAHVDNGRRWSIGHATSLDMNHWDYHGIILAPGKSGDFDDLELATGSVLAHDSKYYMFYTAHAKCDDPKVGTVALACSEDLYHWQKVVSEPIVKLDKIQYESQITGSRSFLHWRDPFVLRQADGFHMFLCARRLDGPVKSRGTVAHLISQDLLNWKTLAPLQVQPLCEEMECPQVHCINGRYYLIYSTHHELLAQDANESEPIPSGGVFCQVSDALCGPYRAKGWGKVNVSHDDGYFYAHQLVNKNRKYHLIGTVIPSANQAYVSDTLPVEVMSDTIHIIQ